MSKTEFKSFWGDLSVPEESVQKVEPKKEDTPPADPPAGPKAEDEDTPPAPETPPADVKDEGEEIIEQIEYSDEDIEVAFAVLDDEGVLDISDEDEFDQSPKGLADAVATTVRNRVAKELQNVPAEVAQFYQHVKNGGSFSDFTPQIETDWTQVDEPSEDVQVAALREFYARQGMETADIQAEIDDAVESGKVEKKADIAIKALAKQQEEASEAAKTAAKEAEKANADKVKQEVDGIHKLIDESKELAGFELDDKRREGFKEYLFKKNPRTGKTQMQENMSDDERRLTIAYLDYVNYSKSDFEKETKTKLTRKRKKALSKHTDTRMSKGGDKSIGSKSPKKTSVKDFRFPDLFGGGKIEVED